jgi:hypothetical protein
MKMLAVKLVGNTTKASGSHAVAGIGPIVRTIGCSQ